jgi:hypothetical protein
MICHVDSCVYVCRCYYSHFYVSLAMMLIRRLKIKIYVVIASFVSSVTRAFLIMILAIIYIIYNCRMTKAMTRMGAYKQRVRSSAAFGTITERQETENNDPVRYTFGDDVQDSSRFNSNDSSGLRD